MTNELSTGQAGTVPAYLKTAEPAGLADVGQYQRLQRLKVIQAQTDADLRRSFPTGSLLLRPDNALVAKPGEEVTASVLYFFPSWEAWLDINDPASEERPVASSMDPKSDVAERARDPKRRAESYPNPKKPNEPFLKRFVESLNFVLLVRTGSAANALAVASFNRGSYGIGQALCGYLKRRGVHVYANRVTLWTHEVTGEKGSWQVAAWKPADPAFADEGELAALKATFDGLAKAHANGGLGVSYGEDREPGSDG